MATEVKVPTLGESITEATLGAVAQAARRAGRRRTSRSPASRPTRSRSRCPRRSPARWASSCAKVGDNVAVGAVIAHDRGRRRRRGARRAPPAAPPVNPDGRRREYRAQGGRAGRRGRGRAAPDPVARGAPDRARASSRSLEDQGHRQGRPPDQGRRARRRRRRRRPRRRAARARARRRPGPGAAPAAPRPREAGERREERVRMTRLRQTVARRLKEAQNTAAMLTTFNDVDMSAVMEARAPLQGSVREEARHPPRLHGLLREGGGARRARRARGQRLDRGRGDRLSRLCRRLGRGLGAATAWSSRSSATPRRMSFAEIEKTIADFGRRAKDGTLTMEEMQGGTFTISNGGVFGSLLSTPIINPPQSAVLGMHRIEERPVVRDGQIVARPMMYLALVLRPPPDRRPRGGHLPGPDEGSARGSDAASDRSCNLTVRAEPVEAQSLLRYRWNAGLRQAQGERELRNGRD